jgi:heat shock protein HslJ
MRGLLLAFLLLGACATGSPGRIGGAWRAVDINGAPVAATPATLQLEGGRISGTAACNTYSGTYEAASGERVRFGTLATTRKLCDDAAMDEERRFLSIMENVVSYSLYGDGSLSLIAADGRAIRFRRS